jgi:DHA1 family solute carrier family 18 vesicular amine transporter 1/2
MATLATSNLFGTLSEKFGRIRVMIMGSLALSASTVMFAFANSVWMLVVSRILQGIAASANFTPGLSLVSELSNSNSLGEVLGSITGWSGLGLLIGPPLGGLLF